jgi:F-type H+-transporting ATPase subunit epsilon
MVNTIQIDVVSAEESIFSEEAEFVVAPAQMGEVGIYPNHASMITLLKAGSVRIKKINKSDEDLIYISGGILEVQPHVVTVLSDTAIRADDLNESAAIEAKQRAEAALADQNSEFDIAKAKGARVIAAASSKIKRDACLAAGADDVVDYSSDNWREQLKKILAGTFFLRIDFDLKANMINCV